MVRTPTFDKNGLKKGAWSPEEDNKLGAYIQRYGHWNWRELPKFAGLARCGKSCRLRWMNYLRPDVRRGNYTKEEDDIILKLHQELGNKWAVIARKLEGRTDNEIKNHWHTHLKNQAKRYPKRSKAKRHSGETSQCEASQNIGLEHENTFGDGASHRNLQDSSLSLERSSSEFSSLSYDYALASSGMDWAAENCSSSETFSEFSGDFWAEPFLTDNPNIQTVFPPHLLEGGFTSPHASYYDAGVDLFY